MKSKSLRHRWPWPFAAMCLAANAQAGPRVQLSTGVQYSDGSYGETTNTQAIVVPFTARIGFGAWTVQSYLPYVSVAGPENLGELLDDGGGRGSNSGSGGGGSGSSGSDGGGDSGDDDPPNVPQPEGPPAFADDREASGIGDSSLSVTYSMDSLRESSFYLDLTGRVRFPTGDERQGLGVGATDFMALGELGVSTPRGGVFVSGGRRFLGDVADRQRVDGWQAAAGGWLHVSPHVTVGLTGDWRDASTPGDVAPSFLDTYVAWRIDDAWKVELNAGLGLSSASADFATGITISWRNAGVRRRPVRS